MSQFSKWLAALAASGKGGTPEATLYCDRGVPFSKLISVQSDLTGSTIRGEVRASPDATGTALASFTVSALSVVSGVTGFTISLDEATVNALPAPGDGEGVALLVYDLLITPAASSEERLFGGIFQVTGQVTA